jgi:hypothetical protein
MPVLEQEPKSRIKNGIVEELFEMVSTPRQQEVYNAHLEAGRTSLATAEASKVVKKWFVYDRETERRLGVDVQYKAQVLFERKSR